MIRKKPSHLIIGVHGLDNKVSKRQLSRWWKAAIAEGLSNAGHPFVSIRFELFYWAKHTHSRPLDPGEKREGHPLYLSRPYTPAGVEPGAPPSAESRPSLLGWLFRRTIDRVLTHRKTRDEPGEENRLMLEQTFPDLDLYFSNKRVFSYRHGLKDLLHGELEKLLRKYAKSRILLVGHSMGSIIAYEVLQTTTAKVEALATLGSPLGFPGVKKRLAKSLNLRLTDIPLMPTPDTISSSWINISDPHDIIAYFSPLSDHYCPSHRGVIVEDHTTSNDYVQNGTTIHHNVYGYLRSRPMSTFLLKFLGLDTSKNIRENDNETP